MKPYMRSFAIGAGATLLAALLGFGALFVLEGNTRQPHGLSLFPTATFAPPTEPQQVAAVDQPIPTSPPEPSPTPASIDTIALEAAFEDTIQAAYDRYGESWQIGVAFVDLETGQRVSIDGNLPYYSLSTFKAPLAAYYLWLIEQGELEPQASDIEYIEPMLLRSDNPSTSCMLKKVGGLPPFNDWLVDELGMLRQENFVARWDSWYCEQGTETYLVPTDWRYFNGDESVGLPARGDERPCPTDDVLCDKAFTPNELVGFYQMMYEGQIVDAVHTEQWFEWMEKERDESALFDGLPESDASIRVYTKNGFRANDGYYDMHFYHEAGIIKTVYGDFAIAVFSQGNPDWPGTWLHADLAADAYAAVEAKSRP